ncbi:MAG TPA: CvpA family protein [Candidatus Baltobacteraceae bacterium]|nr:CvpA family protein [Candidatus Baltobacteraceae bacterium]
MIGGVPWPDIAIAVILIIAGIKGFMRGFVSELGGAVAVVAGLVAPWYYNGTFDGWLESQVHLGPGSAHVVGMFATGFIAYAIVIAISWALSRIAKLPVLNIGNSIGGAAIGLLKGAVLLWLVLFVALYFPLSRDIRTDLHNSRLAPYFVTFDSNIDKSIESIIPWYARPALWPYFHRHHL